MHPKIPESDNRFGDFFMRQERKKTGAFYLIWMS
jgi:hypothetical protein